MSHHVDPRPRPATPARAAVAALAVLVAAFAGAQENPTSPSNYDSLGWDVPAVYGYVTGTDGKPIEQAKVEIYLNSAFRTDYAVTDRNGFYFIAVPQVSDFWEVKASADGYYSSSTSLGIYRRERSDFTLRPDPNAQPQEPLESRDRRKARKTMAEGLELARKGDREGAIAKLEEATKIDPAYEPAFNNLGVNLRLAGRLQEAETVFRQAVELNPVDYYAHFNLGTLLFDTHRPHEAAPMLERAILADPTSPMAEAMLGRSYLELGLAKRALEHLETAQKLADGKLDMTLEISDAYVLSGDLAKALQTKEAWLSSHKSDPRAEQVHATVAALQKKLGETE